MPNRIRQLFCRHKKTSPHIKKELFLALNGQNVYHICDKCGRIVREEFVSNEEFYTKYRTC